MSHQMLSLANPAVNTRPGSFQEEPSDYSQLVDAPTGEYVMPPMLAASNLALTSGQLKLAGFTATRTERIGSLSTVGTSPAGATPTLCRVGVWELDPITGVYTLVASSANDTSLWSTIATVRTSPLTGAPFLKVAGRRYMVGALCVTAAALPSIVGLALNASTVYLGLIVNTTNYAYGGALLTQTDLPVSFVPLTALVVATATPQFRLNAA